MMAGVGGAGGDHLPRNFSWIIPGVIGNEFHFYYPMIYYLIV